MAIALTPDKSKVVVGGSFTTMNGSASAYGLGAVDAVTGALRPWLANGINTGNIRNAGSSAAINSLSTDGHMIFGSGYHFGAGGSIEGSFSMDPADGRLDWVQDCHGDTYDTSPIGGVLYTVGHPHFCGNTFGHPQQTPWRFQRASAVTTDARGENQPNSTGGYADHGAWASALHLHWYPDLQAGTYTGQDQAAWTVDGNNDYVVLGGEFPIVNGTSQQGLVRFAAPAKAPRQSGPRLAGWDFRPKLQSLEPGAVRVSFPANWDRDSEFLTYRVYRDYSLSNPVYEVTAPSKSWNRTMLGFTDTGLDPGRSYGYHIRVTDPDGNMARGDSSFVTVASSGTLTNYARAVLDDLPITYWRMEKPPARIWWTLRVGPRVASRLSPGVSPVLFSPMWIRRRGSLGVRVASDTESTGSKLRTSSQWRRGSAQRAIPAGWSSASAIPRRDPRAPRIVNCSCARTAAWYSVFTGKRVACAR